MDSISAWVESIIVAIIISTIIEMVLPDGRNAKYVKMVIGVFILFTIISPAIKKINNGSNILNIDSYVTVPNNKTVATNSNIGNEKLILQMYEENLKTDIKAKISRKGYTIENINVEILNDGNYTLNSIYIKISGRSELNENSGSVSSRNISTVVENIENIIINVGGDNKKEDVSSSEKSIISESERRKLINYLSSVYEVRDKNITVI